MSLGVSVTFAVAQYSSRNPMFQPSLKAMKAARDAFHWHISELD